MRAFRRLLRRTLGVLIPTIFGQGDDGKENGDYYNGVI